MDEKTVTEQLTEDLLKENGLEPANEVAQRLDITVDDVEAVVKALEETKETVSMGGEVNSGQLLAFVERIERMEEEKKAAADDIKDIYAEAKGNGFDTKVLKQVVKIRAMDRDELSEAQAVLDLYLAALGINL